MIRAAYIAKSPLPRGRAKQKRRAPGGVARRLEGWVADWASGFGRASARLVDQGDGEGHRISGVDHHGTDRPGGNYLRHEPPLQATGGPEVSPGKRCAWELVALGVIALRECPVKLESDPIRDVVVDVVPVSGPVAAGADRIGVRWLGPARVVVDRNVDHLVSRLSHAG